MTIILVSRTVVLLFSPSSQEWYSLAPQLLTDPSLVWWQEHHPCWAWCRTSRPGTPWTEWTLSTRTTAFTVSARRASWIAWTTAWPGEALEPSMPNLYITKSKHAIGSLALILFLCRHVSLPLSLLFSHHTTLFCFHLNLFVHTQKKSLPCSVVPFFFLLVYSLAFLPASAPYRPYFLLSFNSQLAIYHLFLSARSHWLPFSGPHGRCFALLFFDFFLLVFTILVKPAFSPF